MEKRLNQAMRSRRAGQRGFTLIELLVVIAVLAVLAAVVIFNVTGVANRGKASACATDVKSVQSAIDAWVNDNPTAGQAAQAGPPAVPAGPTIPANSPASLTGAGSWLVAGGPLVTAYLHTTPDVTECAGTAMTINGAMQTGFTVAGK